MERVGDDGGVWRHDLEHPPVGTREVDRAEADAGSELGALVGQPGHGLDTPPTRDDVEELATVDVDQLGREVLTMVRTDPGHEHLVHPEGRDLTEPVRISLEEPFAVGDHRVVHRVPVAAEVLRHLRDAPGTSADLFGHPLGRPCGEGLARSGDALVDLSPTARLAVFVGTLPASLVPDEPGCPALQREVDQVDGRSVLDRRHTSAARTARAVDGRLHVDPSLALWAVFAEEEPDLRQSDHPGQRARRVSHQRGSSISGRRTTSDWWTPATRRGSSVPAYTPLKSEVPSPEAPQSMRHGAHGEWNLAKRIDCCRLPALRDHLFARSMGPRRVHFDRLCR